MYASLALLAPYLQTLMNYPVLTAGVVLAPRGAGLMVAALICGRVIGKISARLLVGTGFMIGAYALHEMTLWTPDISEWNVITVGFVQGLSIGFLAIPINIIAFATLPSAIRTEATSIYSLMRNLGSAIGISSHRRVAADQHAGQSRDPGRGCDPVQSRPAESGAAARLWNPDSMHGLLMLNQEVTRQATIIAYVDDFKLMLVLAIIVTPLLLLTRGAPAR